MRLKKGLFGYLNFVPCTIIMSVYLYTLLFSLCGYFEKKAGLSIFLYGINISYFVSASLMVLVVGLFFVVLNLKKQFEFSLSFISPVLRTINFWVVFAGILAYGIYSRMLLIESINSDSYASIDFSSLFLVDDYTTLGFVKNVYFNLLLYSLKVFGTGILSILIVNLVLVIASAVFVSFAVKFIYGRIPALFLFVYLMTCKTVIRLNLDFSGSVFFVFAVSFILFVVCFLFSLINVNHSTLKTTLILLTFFALVALSHMGYSKFVFNLSFNETLVDYSVVVSLFASILISVFALYGMLSFFGNDTDTVSPLGLILLGVVLLCAYFTDNNTLFPVITSLLVVFSGVGFEWIAFFDFKKENLSFEKTITADFENNITEEFVIVPALDEEKPVIKDEPVINNNVSAIDTAVIIDKTPATESQKPRFIDNPLPVPKKHVKKSINYAFEPTLDQMKYDIDISESDDFDIK